MRACETNAMTQSKKPFWIIVIALVVPAIAATWFAWTMTGGIRDEARVTDTRLRELAWSVLAYADEFNVFPTNEAQLRAFTTSATGVPSSLTKPNTVGADRVYPLTRSEALIAAPIPTLDESLTCIDIEWGLASDVQPILRSKGKATMQGTGPTVGRWLYAMSERLRAK
ncbi:MAG: hypothetical protein DWI10_00770 [Planctomycetota bacterium]|nr:MAG: hypothetical protein DWI10_00770 [Planctomycetota bacterium]